MISPDSPKMKALEAYKTEQKGSFRCGVQTIHVLETPLAHLWTVSQRLGLSTLIEVFKGSSFSTKITHPYDAPRPYR